MFEPLRVVVLTSRRAPGLEYLLEDDAQRGRVYEIAGVLSSDPECLERRTCEAHGIPFVVHDLRAFAAERGARWTDLAFRERYDEALLAAIEPWHANAIACAGYLHVLTRRVLEAFPGRVVNVHDADLAITDEHGRPKYRGLRSTRDAILAGERETRCTVHVVTSAVDDGPVIARSRAFPVHAMVDDARWWAAADILKAYAYAHREWMMRSAFGPLLAQGVAWLETVHEMSGDLAATRRARAIG